MAKFSKNIFILSVLSAHLCWGHGEDKLGPHGGFIKMPGAFHTELVPEENNKFKVYLLDMEWKNPSVVDAKVDVVIQDSKSKKSITISCASQQDYFQCALPSSVDLKKKGELKILSQREKQKGNEISYSLPLKVENKEGGHHGHH